MVLGASRFALGKQLEVLNSTASASVTLRAARDMQEHLARLYPAALDIAVTSPELVQPGQPARRLADIFEVPDDADDAQVIDLARVAYRRVVEYAHQRGELSEGEQKAALVRRGPLSPNLQARVVELEANQDRTADEERELRQLRGDDLLRLYEHAAGGR